MSDPARSVCFYCADQNPHCDKSLGITNYTHGLLQNLQASGRVSLRAVSSTSSAGVPEEVQRFTFPFRTDNVLGRLIADHLHPVLTPQRDSEIWHYPKGFLPLTFQVRAPKVGTIADTILQFYADNYPTCRSSGAFRYWIAMLKNAIRRLDLILTISEFSRGAILEFSERYSLTCPPIVVTYQGVDIGDSKPSNGRQKENYVVHAASKHPHKKTEWLIRQWLVLEQSERHLPELYLIGEVGEAIAAIASSSRRIKTYPSLPRNQLFSLISKARALLLPSEIEGFGLPAVEAYLLGTPVGYVRGTAVEEILGPNSPGGFRLTDDSFGSALSELLEMDPSLIAGKTAELAHRFSWKRCVDLTLDVYRKVS